MKKSGLMMFCGILLVPWGLFSCYSPPPYHQLPMPVAEPTDRIYVVMKNTPLDSLCQEKQIDWLSPDEIHWDSRWIYYSREVRQLEKLIGKEKIRSMLSQLSPKADLLEKAYHLLIPWNKKIVLQCSKKNPEENDANLVCCPAFGFDAYSESEKDSLLPRLARREDVRSIYQCKWVNPVQDKRYLNMTTWSCKPYQVNAMDSAETK